MGNKKKYIIVSPFFPTNSDYVGSYIYDQVRAIIDLSDYELTVIKIVPFFSLSKKSNTYFGSIIWFCLSFFSLKSFVVLFF